MMTIDQPWSGSSVDHTVVLFINQTIFVMLFDTMIMLEMTVPVTNLFSRNNHVKENHQNASKAGKKERETRFLFIIS